MQVSKSEEPPSQTLVSQLQSQLDSMRQAHRELQVRLEGTEIRVREKEREVRILQEELNEKRKQLGEVESMMKVSSFSLQVWHCVHSDLLWLILR